METLKKELEGIKRLLERGKPDDARKQIENFEKSLVSIPLTKDVLTLTRKAFALVWNFVNKVRQKQSHKASPSPFVLVFYTKALRLLSYVSVEECLERLNETLLPLIDQTKPDSSLVCTLFLQLWEGMGARCSDVCLQTPILRTLFLKWVMQTTTFLLRDKNSKAFIPLQICWKFLSRINNETSMDKENTTLSQKQGGKIRTHDILELLAVAMSYFSVAYGLFQLMGIGKLPQKGDLKSLETLKFSLTQGNLYLSKLPSVVLDPTTKLTVSPYRLVRTTAALLDSIRREYLDGWGLSSPSKRQVLSIDILHQLDLAMGGGEGDPIYSGYSSILRRLSQCKQGNSFVIEITRAMAATASLKLSICLQESQKEGRAIEKDELNPIVKCLSFAKSVAERGVVPDLERCERIVHDTYCMLANVLKKRGAEENKISCLLLERGCEALRHSCTSSIQRGVSVEDQPTGESLSLLIKNHKYLASQYQQTGQTALALRIAIYGAQVSGVGAVWAAGSRGDSLHPPYLSDLRSFLSICIKLSEKCTVSSAFESLWTSFRTSLESLPPLNTEDRGWFNPRVSLSVVWLHQLRSVPSLQVLFTEKLLEGLEGEDVERPKSHKSAPKRKSSEKGIENQHFQFDFGFPPSFSLWVSLEKARALRSLGFINKKKQHLLSAKMSLTSLVSLSDSYSNETAAIGAVLGVAHAFLAIIQHDLVYFNSSMEESQDEIDFPETRRVLLSQALEYLEQSFMNGNEGNEYLQDESEEHDLDDGEEHDCDSSLSEFLSEQLFDVLIRLTDYLWLVAPSLYLRALEVLELAANFYGDSQESWKTHAILSRQNYFIQHGIFPENLTPLSSEPKSKSFSEFRNITQHTCNLILTNQVTQATTFYSAASVNWQDSSDPFVLSLHHSTCALLSLASGEPESCITSSIIALGLLKSRIQFWISLSGNIARDTASSVSSSGKSSPSVGVWFDGSGCSAWRLLRDVWNIFWVIGAAYHAVGQPMKSQYYYERSLTLSRMVGLPFVHSLNLIRMTRIDVCRGRPSQVVQKLHNLFSQASDRDDPHEIPLLCQLLLLSGKALLGQAVNFVSSGKHEPMDGDLESGDWRDQGEDEGETQEKGESKASLLVQAVQYFDKCLEMVRKYVATQPSQSVLKNQKCLQVLCGESLAPKQNQREPAPKRKSKRVAPRLSTQPSLDITETKNPLGDSWDIFGFDEDHSEADCMGSADLSVHVYFSCLNVENLACLAHCGKAEAYAHLGDWFQVSKEAALLRQSGASHPSFSLSVLVVTLFSILSLRRSALLTTSDSPLTPRRESPLKERQSAIQMTSLVSEDPEAVRGSIGIRGRVQAQTPKAVTRGRGRPRRTVDSVPESLPPKLTTSVSVDMSFGSLSQRPSPHSHLSLYSCLESRWNLSVKRGYPCVTEEMGKALASCSFANHQSRDSFLYLADSIGTMARSQLRRKRAQQSPPEQPDDVSKLTHQLSKIKLKEGENEEVLPPDLLFGDFQSLSSCLSSLPWAVCCIGAGMDGHHLIIARYDPQQEGEPLVRRVRMSSLRSSNAPPFLESVPSSSVPIEEGVLAFQQVMLNCQKTSQSAPKIPSKATEKEKKAWWNQRTQLDEDLKWLCNKIEESWLGPWSGMLLGDYEDERIGEAIETNIQKISKSLLSKGYSIDVDLFRSLYWALPFLEERKTLLTSSVASLLVPSGGKGQSSQTKRRATGGRKQQHRDGDLEELAGQVVRTMVNSYAKEIEKFSEVDCFEKRKPMLLVIDRSLQSLPWESLPILRAYAQPICRLPSLSFVSHWLSDIEGKRNKLLREGVDPNSLYYIINPDGKDPVKGFRPRQRQLWKTTLKDVGLGEWNGLLNVPPQSSNFEQAAKNKDVLMYVGHNGGQQYIRESQVEKLDFQSAVLLLGCSSGRARVEGDFGPSGIALSYLVAGAPSVVGNLWDVTDVDSDNFNVEMVSRWLRGREEETEMEQPCSLAHAVAEARSVCRLEYIVGGAPVCYGFPVFTKSFDQED